MGILNADTLDGWNPHGSVQHRSQSVNKLHPDLLHFSCQSQWDRCNIWKNVSSCMLAHFLPEGADLRKRLEKKKAFSPPVWDTEAWYILNEDLFFPQIYVNIHLESSNDCSSASCKYSRRRWEYSLTLIMEQLPKRSDNLRLLNYNSIT